jgi:hypothetical protein
MASDRVLGDFAVHVQRPEQAVPSAIAASPFASTTQPAAESTDATLAVASTPDPTSAPTAHHPSDVP